MSDGTIPGGDSPPSRGQYKDGNVDPNGGYIIGKGRPPEGGKFREGDGRKRGRRAKGTANLETDFLAEARAKITIDEGGKKIRVTKQQALVKRLFDKGFKGDVSALRETLSQLRGIADRQSARADRNLGQHDLEVIDQYFEDLMRGFEIPALDKLSDPSKQEKPNG